MKKWHMEKLVTSEGFWIIVCIARGQEERVVIWFETLLEGTPKKPTHKPAVGFKITPLEIHLFGSSRVPSWMTKISGRGYTLYLDI